jgi:Protein of unknown function (DUF1592)/Protein of unknown function (DUF1588)/Protein of unknown function (DUF1595)/Protein of unknown function (DUF1585)/Protein of unknown function (DUF1587)
MRFHPVRARAVCLAVGLLAGCTGQIGDGSGHITGSGSGNTTGSGSAGASGTAGSGASGTAGAGASSTGGDTGTGGMGVPGSLDLSGSPKYYRIVRLTNAQWAQAIQTVLNVPSGGLEQTFETAVSGTTDFSNNELVLGFDSRNWQDYQTAAESLAAQLTATDTALKAVYSGTDPAGLITTLGRRAYRRPLTTAEQSTYMALYNQGSSLMGTRSAFAKGASLVIRAMLQSPYFLFRTELGAKGAPLSSFEIAAKLSLWLRGTSPDDKTLDLAAGTGKLDTADGAAALATTMLGETTATTAMRQFHGEWLHFDDYALISKVGVSNYSTALNAELQEASYRFFDNIFTQGLGVKDMLLSTTGFYGPGMAKLYGLTAPASGTYAQADLGTKRVGYFSQLPYLTLNGNNAEPNSILRGVTLNREVVCATLGPPAANLPPIPPLMPGQTNRQRIDTLTGTCGQTCHNDMINPLGFAFEHFDGMGQWRDTENGGLTIDSSGSYTFADGTTQTWTDAFGLMQVLAATSQTHTCYAKKLASYALQRDVVTSDMPMLTSLTSASMAAGGSVKQLVIQLVRNDAFRTHGGP